MTERFYEKFLSFFFSLAILLMLVFATVQLLIIYVFYGFYIFYVLYFWLVLFSSFYGFKWYLAFKDFQENLYLFIPNSRDSNPAIEPLNMEIDDLPLKVCLWYQQGAKFEDIQGDLGFTHPEQVKRELRKGLSFLLRFYNEHRDKG